MSPQMIKDWPVEELGVKKCIPLKLPELIIVCISQMGTEFSNTGRLNQWQITTYGDFMNMS